MSGGVSGNERAQYHALRVRQDSGAQPSMLRIGMIAGESSGDQLGAGLMRAIRAREPDAEFEGAAGPAMIAAGCRPLVHAETFAVMGITEVLAHLPRLLRVRRRLYRHFLQHRPDVLIGIDMPDFNLGLEARLRKAGIRTVHYVSPSIWAWRARRVFKVGKAAELVLTLLPFEQPLFAQHGFHAVYVGHPLADRAPRSLDRAALRRALHLPVEDPLVALLPGSRFTEVERLLPVFLETAQWLANHLPQLRFAMPAASPALSRHIKNQVRMLVPDLPVTVIEGHAQEILGAANAALIASGTATLEAMLWRCPMVVAYRLSAGSYALVKGLGLLRVPHVALPNLLAGREVVPEFLQYRALPLNLGNAILRLLQDARVRDAQLQSFAELERGLRLGANERAAAAVLDLLQQPAVTPQARAHSRTDGAIS
ncbi:MAG: lipid-A-disaccharide synthase [Gammaproteobacteria bacterium]|nr:lipid-A-disaccharide synthase [Gammaproteobacteria bacterium]